MERRGEFLRCPWHGWEFDLATGQSWCDPRRTKVRNFEVKLEVGSELVMGNIRSPSRTPISWSISEPVRSKTSLAAFHFTGSDAANWRVTLLGKLMPESFQSDPSK